MYVLELAIPKFCYFGASGGLVCHLKHISYFTIEFGLMVYYFGLEIHHQLLLDYSIIPQLLGIIQFRYNMQEFA